jgi:DNA-binding transcriptional ArsR family regulator
MRKDVFQAIADPIQRQIINMIALESITLNAVAEKFDVSRAAISKHINILTECGLNRDQTTRQGKILRS